MAQRMRVTRRVATIRGGRRRVDPTCLYGLNKTPVVFGPQKQPTLPAKRVPVGVVSTGAPVARARLSGRRYVSPNGSDRSPRRSWRRRLPQALALGLVVVTATGCSSETMPRLGMPRPATEEAPRILALWQGSWVAALAVGCLVWGLIVWSVIFHRRKRHKQ